MANNYGILKAGDGGNGGRGLDGKGGNDTVETTIAPTHGIEGEYDDSLTEGGKQYASDGGAAGSVSGITNIEANGQILTSSNGSKGTRGNDGWGGLNLVKYIYNYPTGTKSFNPANGKMELGTIKMTLNAGLEDPETIDFKILVGNRSMDWDYSIGLNIEKGSIEFYIRNGLDTGPDYMFYGWEKSEDVKDIEMYFTWNLKFLGWATNSLVTNTFYSGSYISSYVYANITSAELFDYASEKQ